MVQDREELYEGQAHQIIVELCAQVRKLGGGVEDVARMLSDQTKIEKIGLLLVGIADVVELPPDIVADTARATAIRVKAIKQVSEDEPNLLTWLGNLAYDEDARVRVAAIKRIKDLEWLLEYASSRVNDEGGALAALLQFITLGAKPEYLLHVALKSTHPKVRRKAVEALGRASILQYVSDEPAPFIGSESQWMEVFQCYSFDSQESYGQQRRDLIDLKERARNPAVRQAARNMIERSIVVWSNKAK